MRQAHSLAIEASQLPVQYSPFDKNPDTILQKVKQTGVEFFAAKPIISTTPTSPESSTSIEDLARAELLLKTARRKLSDNDLQGAIAAANEAAGLKAPFDLIGDSPQSVLAAVEAAKVNAETSQWLAQKQATQQPVVQPDPFAGSPSPTTPMPQFDTPRELVVQGSPIEAAPQPIPTPDKSEAEQHFEQGIAQLRQRLLKECG